MAANNNEDTVLIISPNVCVDEALRSNSILDPRYTTGSIVPSKDYIGIQREISPGSNWTLGPAVRNQLQLGSGYTTEVVDFGDAVSVKISYVSTKTGAGASKNFIILFKNPKGASCVVKSTATRWRTCNDISQAVSYIRSRVSNLQSRTSSIS